MGEDGKTNPESRGRDVGAEKVLVALIIRVGNQGDAGSQKFGPGRFNLDIATRCVFTNFCCIAVENQLVVVARVLTRLDLGLSDSGLQRDVPKSGGFSAVRFAASEVLEESSLGDQAGVGADGLVGHSPVNRKAQVAPQ